MKAYSLDLREKIVETYKAGGITQRELAARFRVFLFFVVKLMRLHRQGKQLQAKTQGGNLKPILTRQMRRFIQMELIAQNDLTLPELCDRAAAEFDVRVSPPTMCRALKQMNLKRKKRPFMPKSEKAKG